MCQQLAQVDDVSTLVESGQCVRTCIVEPEPDANATATDTPSPPPPVGPACHSYSIQVGLPEAKGVICVPPCSNVSIIKVSQGQCDLQKSENDLVQRVRITISDVFPADFSNKKLACDHKQSSLAHVWTSLLTHR